MSTFDGVKDKDLNFGTLPEERPSELSGTSNKISSCQMWATVPLQKLYIQGVEISLKSLQIWWFSSSLFSSIFCSLSFRALKNF